MEKHFVTFLSPGTFFNEGTTKEIATWCTQTAKEMAKTVEERYGSKPYAFYFTTRERGDNDLDSKQTKKSNQYFLGGRVMTLEDVKREMGDEKTLISNMECNGWNRVVVNHTPWRSIQPMHEGDVVV